MNRELLDSLPCFLAYPFAKYEVDQKPSPQILFFILENLLLYVECLLRAQGADRSDLGRPGSLGIRAERILLLSKRVKESHRQPIVEFLEEGRRNADLSLLVAFRNRWAHLKGSDSHGAFENFDGCDAALRRLLEKVSHVSIHLIRRRSVDDKRRTLMLRGLRGLFDAPTSPDDQIISDPADGTLIAYASGQSPVLLAPFLTFSTGTFGENRIRMLARVVGSKTEYVDPVDLFDIG